MSFSGRWYPDHDSDPDRLAAEAGVASYCDLVDVRQAEVDLEDVRCVADLNVIAAMREADSLRKMLPAAKRHGEAEYVVLRGAIACAEERVKAWAELAGTCPPGPA